MSDCKEFWENSFGNDYHKRNRVLWRERIGFWRRILDLTGARSAHEFGCGPGWNLSAIKAAAEWDVQVRGNEINESALLQAWNAGLDVSKARPKPNSAELTFTAGVLIHIQPAELGTVMQDLIFASTDYVLAVEYEADKETEVEYRGHAGKLWRRPYGKLYQDMGLSLVAAGMAEGFDRCWYTLLRK